MSTWTGPPAERRGWTAFWLLSITGGVFGAVLLFFSLLPYVGCRGSAGGPKTFEMFFPYAALLRGSMLQGVVFPIILMQYPIYGAVLGYCYKEGNFWLMVFGSIMSFAHVITALLACNW